MTTNSRRTLLRFLSCTLLASFSFAAFALNNQLPFVKRANLNQETASSEVRHMADWVVDSDDNKHMPFVILDKKEAKVFVFQANGILRGASPVLLGITVGDDSFPGAGDKPLSQVLPEEKTTPAGRFVAASDKNIKGADIIWVDYASSISMHAQVEGTPAERRAERLASPVASDRRISYGCVNIPTRFFRTTLLPSFKKSDGIVYVLPEVWTKQRTFGAYYDVNEREKHLAAAQHDPDNPDDPDDPIARFANSAKQLAKPSTDQPSN